MRDKLIKLTSDLISIDSVSKNSNKKIIDYCRKLLEENSFITETIKYNNGEDKYNLVAKKGDSKGGLAFIMHIDTVPLASEDQLTPTIENNRIYGRGACDMKGPIAAALLAGVDFDITFIITADEEIGCVGAQYVVEESKLLKSNPPKVAIVTEPTELIPIHAHKGLSGIKVTAKGVANHSSLDSGINANFKIAPFIFEISKLKEKYMTNSDYQCDNFIPKTNGLNMVISDNNCPLNITAPYSRASISFRTMPDCKSEEIVDEIKSIAREYNLEFESYFIDPIYIDSAHPFVKLAEDVTKREAETVPYLTDAFRFKAMLTPIILGPGSIKEAHTKDEFIDIDELVKGYDIYRSIILKYLSL